jgi:hypothetical protein
LQLPVVVEVEVIILPVVVEAEVLPMVLVLM